MAKYYKQEMPDLRKTGEKKAYYRMENAGNISTEALIDKICSHPGLGVSDGVAQLVLATLAGEMSLLLAEGHSVTLDGVGTFTVRLGLNKRAKAIEAAGAEGERNAASIVVNGVNFAADRELVKAVATHCKLERADTHHVNRSPYSIEERHGLLTAYLSDGTHTFVKVADYVAMTHLSPSTASKELKNWASDPTSPIAAKGRGPAKVYVKRG